MRGLRLVDEERHEGRPFVHLPGSCLVGIVRTTVCVRLGCRSTRRSQSICLSTEKRANAVSVLAVTGHLPMSKWWRFLRLVNIYASSACTYVTEI